MKSWTLRFTGCLLALLLLVPAALPSAQNGRPALVVVIVVDQLRAESLERFHDQFGNSGFRTFLDRGAWFAACNYDYATTFTAPGHASLFTGTYPFSHGIYANEWWDPQRKKRVTSVEDAAISLVGPGAVSGSTPSMISGTAGASAGASPHNLRSDTLGDELKLATQGRARVFAISLKDRSAVLPGGFSANAAYWIDPRDGAFITSSYYLKSLPEWVADFDRSDHARKYWKLEWKDAAGKLLRTTAPDVKDVETPDFYHIVGMTPFANDYEFEFARELLAREKLGSGPVTDVLAISLSANDILGHKVGSDSPEAQAMVLALDRQIGDFLGFLGRQVGLANVWVVLASDHGVAPLNGTARQLRLPAPVVPVADARTRLNAAVARRMNVARGDFVRWIEWPIVYLNEESFAGNTEADAERTVAEALLELGARRTFAKAQMAAGDPRTDAIARRFQHSYSPLGSWYVMAEMPPFTLDKANETTHGSPYSYDTHVPLAFFGISFRPGVYRSHCEPVDMAPTLASALGINPPAGATGRVLTEALAASRPTDEK